MKRKLLSKTTLALFLTLFAVNTYAQQGVQVVCVNNESLFVPLSQLSRMSFSNDLEAMHLELNDGSVQQVLLSDLGRVSFAQIAGEETEAISLLDSGAETLKVVVGDKCLIGSGTTEPLRSMALYDVTGKRVAVVQGNGRTMELRIDTAGLSVGVYIVNIESASQRMTRKVVLN